MVEIEIKAKLNQEDVNNLVNIGERLCSNGFKESGSFIERDIYFNAPDRDFAQTDEALRIRSSENIENKKKDVFITYKGKKLDQISKTRNEYEICIGNEETMVSLLKALRYTIVRNVKKLRKYYEKGKNICVFR